ncbi:ImmA/IrrE family metallo-endopeptidase [Pseudomonas sp. BN414]|uniref:ImmA/IrrE family metallo-endopeptidase n=1 Tax=Pseudomonas sp. BN414 TaxID=2567888 RepID=UPI0024564100|nr:XRE family transcriptional regulator [Pseudomonas sp. BN414]MDH4566152.1 ImmA/IrrE family metallo-endopeptidase [Pseudomonas sp. BN414]
MEQVNPAVIVWARETAGLSPEEAGKALSLGGKRLSGAEALLQYETGAKAPTRPLLLKMAKTYHRPLLTFYLAQPPRIGDRGEDFRTLPEERRVEDKGTLDALVRDLYVRQRLVSEALEDAEEADPRGYVGALSIDLPIESFAQKVVEILGFDLGAFRQKRTIEDSFTYARGLAERAGVFVLLTGNLGSHHSNVSTEVFRGFALSDKIAPFIAINDQDAKSAWTFTLLHEMAHICLGESGISGSYAEQRTEKYCNDIASQILLPKQELANFEPRAKDLEEFVVLVGDFARQRKISSAMVTYRLWQKGSISKENWQQATERFRELWKADKDQQKLKQKSAGKTGPDYYTVKRHKAGAALVNLVRRGVDEGVLTPTKAGRVLGVSPGNVASMVGTR